MVVAGSFRMGREWLTSVSPCRSGKPSVTVLKTGSVVLDLVELLVRKIGQGRLEGKLD